MHGVTQRGGHGVFLAVRCGIAEMVDLDLVFTSLLRSALVSIHLLFLKLGKCLKAKVTTALI